MKTFIQKNFINWKKMKDHVPKDEIKRILKTDTNDQKGTYKVKIEKGDKLKYIQDQQSIEIELIT